MYCARCGKRGDWMEMPPYFGHEKEVFGYHIQKLCKGCYRELCPDPDIFDPDLRGFSFDFFYSAASGTSRKILKTHEAENTLVSYETRCNGRIGTEESHFVDSGGNPQAFDGYDTPSVDYLQYVSEQTTNDDYWALRDYPCTQSVLADNNATVRNFQVKTAEIHQELLDLAPEFGIKAQPVSVLQGTTVKEYLTHIDILHEHDALTDYVAIGGVAAYGGERQQQIILAIRDVLPDRYMLHGFGVNLGGLRMPGVLEALRSADSGYWLKYSMERGGNAQASPWRATTANQLDYDKATYEYLDHRKTLNKLLIEEAWHPDAIEDAEYESEGINADIGDPINEWVDIEGPTNLTQHLNPDIKTVVSHFTPKV